MNNVISTAVKVFPLSKNRPTDRSSRLFYEDNVTNMITQVIDTEGFIIKPSLSEEIRKEYSADGYFELTKDSNGDYFLRLSSQHSLVFNLGGYRFELISDSTSVDLVNLGKATVPSKFTDKKNLYAFICIDKEYKEISGQDEQSKYTGLCLTTDKSDIQKAASNSDYKAVYSLHLMEFTPRLSNANNGEYVIADDPEDSNGDTSPKFISSSFMKYTADSIDLSKDIIDGTREIVVS